jgi:diaminopimelate epimerase
VPRATAFSKYHGLGNDFLIVDRRAGEPPMDAGLARRLCDRHRGVGADGVLSILEPTAEGADVRMEVHNADGTIPETCGNGIRCFTWHVLLRLPELVGRRSLAVETGAGVGEAVLVEVHGVVASVRVDMGRPHLDAADVPTAAPLPTAGPVVDVPLEIEGRTLSVTAVSMGNPHAVIFEGASPEDAASLGPRVEKHPAFPDGANAGFARQRGDAELDLVVWERGVGITQACGSGACAAAVAAVRSKRMSPGTIRVNLPGGPLDIEVPADFDRVHMTGPAAHVFEGSVDLDLFLGTEDRGA